MNKADIVHRWTRHCSNLYKAQMNQDITTQVIKELQEISPPSEEIDNDILEDEVRRAVKRLKNNKSPGNDGIAGEMIKHGGAIVIQEMHKLCDAAWKEGRTQEEWKKSILVILPKKGSALECNNYRTIALMSHLSKVLMMILTERLRTQIEEHLADEQAGFRKDRSTVQQILALRLIAEKARRKNNKIYNCFVDFQKAFDSIDQSITWAVLESYGVDNKLIRLLKETHKQCTGSCQDMR